MPQRTSEVSLADHPTCPIMNLVQNNKGRMYYPCDRMLALKKIELIRGDIKYPFPFSNRIRRIIDNAIERFELQPLSLHVRNESQPTLVLERSVADLGMTKLSLIA